MIDIKKEAEAIIAKWEVVRGARIFSGDRPKLLRLVIALCTRYGNEKLEDAAKVCDVRKEIHIDEIAAAHTARGKSNYGIQLFEATECAAAIRASKEEEG